MKLSTVLPIIVCSALAGYGGFFYGRISAPAANADTNHAEATQLQPAGLKETVLETSPEPAMPTRIDHIEEPLTADDAMAERAKADMHTLTNKQGVQIHAKVLAVSATEVTLRRDDGLETTIPLNVLSANDIEFCTYLREQEQFQVDTVTPQADTPATTDDIDWDSIFGS